MAPQHFQHDDDGYRDWLDRHSSGYVVNVDESDASGTRLHRCDCSFIQGPRQRGTQLTYAYPKVCSPRVDELAPFWSGGHRCQRCTP